MFAWDESDRVETLNERGIDFADMVRFDWSTAHIIEDRRDLNAEQRLIALGYINKDLHFCVLALRNDKIQIFGLGTATNYEEKAHEKAKAIK